MGDEEWGSRRPRRWCKTQELICHVNLGGLGEFSTLSLRIGEGPEWRLGPSSL